VRLRNAQSCPQIPCALEATVLAFQSDLLIRGLKSKRKECSAVNIENTMARPFVAQFAQEFSGRQAFACGDYNTAKQQRSWPEGTLSGAYPTMAPTHCHGGQIDDELPCD